MYVGSDEDVPVSTSKGKAVSARSHFSSEEGGSSDDEELEVDHEDEDDDDEDDDDDDDGDVDDSQGMYFLSCVKY